MYCPKCHAELKGGEAFCPNCGFDCTSVALSQESIPAKQSASSGNMATVLSMVALILSGATILLDILMRIVTSVLSKLLVEAPIETQVAVSSVISLFSMFALGVFVVAIIMTVFSLFVSFGSRSRGEDANLALILSVISVVLCVGYGIVFSVEFVVAFINGLNAAL